MTLFIAICDDEMTICGSLETILINILTKLAINYEIDVFSTGEEICQKINDGANYDLMFLDIELAKEKIGGIEIGNFIREVQNNHLMSIVYMSWHEKYAMQLFKIRPLDFLVKPLQADRIEEVVETYLKIAEFWSGNFTYQIGHDVFNEQIKNIVYFESVGRKLIIYLANGHNKEFYGTLKEVYQQQLEKYDFLFVHAKYVVNFDYIEQIKYNELTLVNYPMTLPISQPKRKEVRTHYMNILEKRRKWTK